MLIAGVGTVDQLAAAAVGTAAGKAEVVALAAVAAADQRD
jgi:hypothetical protein